MSVLLHDVEDGLVPSLLAFGIPKKQLTWRRTFSPSPEGSFLYDLSRRHETAGRRG